MDRLANVKQFFWSLALDGFGIRRHLGLDALGHDVKFVHNRVVPALYQAIKSEDPGYDPEAFHLRGEPTTQANGTGAIRWFVELMEAHKAFQALIEPTGDLYVRLYKEDGQHGCFLDDLRNALMKDDPEWRGPYMAPRGPMPATWTEPEPEPQKPEFSGGLDYDPDVIPIYDKK
ncbi:hypothetical protein [Nocardia sp. NPDC057440]|uniref:hypothetical protein n=1 Tax=Nocardia sp. NPDC057440 TaxID=3346134 RepID=UPI003670B28E